MSQAGCGLFPGSGAGQPIHEAANTGSDDQNKERDKPSKTDEEVDPEAGHDGGGEDEMADQDDDEKDVS